MQADTQEFFWSISAQHIFVLTYKDKWRRIENILHNVNICKYRFTAFKTDTLYTIIQYKYKSLLN